MIHFLVSAYSIKEVKFVGGDEGATSFLDHNWLPEAAFAERMPYNKGWHVGAIKGIHQAMSPPIMIWYDFKSRHITPAEVIVSVDDLLIQLTINDS